MCITWIGFALTSLMATGMLVVGVAIMVGYPKYRALIAVAAAIRNRNSGSWNVREGGTGLVGAPFPARAGPRRPFSGASGVSARLASPSPVWTWLGWQNYRIPWLRGWPSPTFWHACSRGVRSGWVPRDRPWSRFRAGSSSPAHRTRSSTVRRAPASSVSSPKHAGPKPIPGDGEPVLGRLDAIEGCHVAFTHSGEIVTGAPHPLLDPFPPARFS